MDILILLVILIIIFLIAIKFLKSLKTPQKFPYQLSNPLLTRAERSFYGVLCQAVETSDLIFSKVRVADIIKPNKGLSRSQWQSAFNSISSKHFDFVVCNPNNSDVKYVVELDDSSHKNQKKRDHFINNACSASGLPLIRVKAAKSYVVKTIKNEINLSLSPREQEVSEINTNLDNESPKKTEHSRDIQFAPPNTSKSIEESNKAINVCLKCGSEMILRKAKSGKNVGKNFWGCSNFPKCRSVVPIDV